MKALSVAEIQAILKEKIPEGLVVPAHDERGHHYRHTPSGKVFDSVTTQMSGVVDSPHLKVWSAKLAVEYFHEQIIVNGGIQNLDIDKVKSSAILVHNDQFESAGAIGTVGHLAVENYVIEWMKTGKQPTELERFISGTDSREWAILRSAIEFFNDYHFLPVATELLVCSEKDGHAGTLDCLGFIIVPDRKCTQENGKHDFMWVSSSKDWRKRLCLHCGVKATYQFALIDYKTSNSIQKKPTYCAQVSAYNASLRQLTGLKTDLLVIVRFDKKQAKYEVLKVSDPVDSYKAFKQMQKLSAWLKSKDDHAEVLVKKEIISLI